MTLAWRDFSSSKKTKKAKRRKTHKFKHNWVFCFTWLFEFVNFHDTTLTLVVDGWGLVCFSLTSKYKSLRGTDLVPGGWSCRIQMTISLPGTANEGLQTQNLFPLCIFLARLVSESAVVEVRMHMLISYLN